MTRPSSMEARVLAVDPTHRGFGYAVFEGAESLIDWGVRTVLAQENARCTESVARLIDLYRPDALILEDTSATGCRRQARVRRLLDELGTLARRRGVHVRCVSRHKVQKAFAHSGGSNKFQIACSIADRFPELVPNLPPERKPWMSEDRRMATFDAAAFALAFFAGANHSSPARKKSPIVQ